MDFTEKEKIVLCVSVMNQYDRVHDRLEKARERQYTCEMIDPIQDDLDNLMSAYKKLTK